MFSVDATLEKRLGKFVNHSSRHANCVMKCVMVDDKPHLCLFALKELSHGDELRYHYGVTGMPWQKVIARIEIA